MLAILHLVTKTVRAHHCPGMKYHPVSHLTPLPHIDPRMKHTTGADAHLPPDVTSRANLGFIANPGPLLDDDMRANPYVLSISTPEATTAEG